MIALNGCWAYITLYELFLGPYEIYRSLTNSSISRSQAESIIFRKNYCFITTNFIFSNAESIGKVVIKTFNISK